MKIYNSKTNTVDWGTLKKFPEIAALENTPQNVKWHKEGDVYVHTCMVVHAMLNYIEMGHPFISPSHLFEDENFREVLVLAALLHDIGKPLTTEMGEDGLYHCRNHAIEGEKIARNFLNNYFDEKNYLIESKITIICNLVRYHMQPMYILHKSNAEQRILALANNLEKTPMDALLLLKWCDCEGSVYDEDDHYEEVLAEVRKLYYDKVSFQSGEEVIIEKVADNNTCDYTPGHHPNGINPGYRKRNKLYLPITIGMRCEVGFGFSTSPVTRIMSKNLFETKNSIYKITKPDN